MATLGLFDRTGDQQLRDSLLGNGRSVASTQLAQGNRAIQNAAYSQAASARGGNPALAMRNAQNASAAASAEHNYNQAKLRAQEQAQAQQLAQAEDAKRGQVIGGVLGGVGTALGTALGGPAGGAVAGMLGGTLGNAVAGSNGAPAVDKPMVAPTANALTGAAAHLVPGTPAFKAALTAANPLMGNPNVFMQPQSPAPSMQSMMVGGYGQGSAPAQPHAPHRGGRAPTPEGLMSGWHQAQPSTGAVELGAGGNTGIALQTSPQQVATAPMAEGAPLNPGALIPAAQIAQSMAPVAAPAPQPLQPLSTGPAPVYGNNTPPGGFGGMRNGMGGTAPLAQSREDLFNYLRLAGGY